MPIISTSNIRRITTMCGTQIPKALEEKLRAVEGDDAATLEVGVDWATQQCHELLERSVPGIHFYTMNKSLATRRIFQALLNQ
jgi:methylenetetrahydrofolate reductase (NADPH)